MALRQSAVSLFGNGVTGPGFWDGIVAPGAVEAFDVPEFLLKRLLKRDATQMIERLQAEIRRR